MFGPKTPLGKRRTTFADAPEHDLAAIEEAFVEREPVTVVVSEKGWVRTMKGHMQDLSGLAFKTDDKLDHAFFAESTSKLLVFATNGKFYSLDVAKLPGGRGHGEPIRMFIDSSRTPRSSRCSSTRAAANSSSPTPTARALSSTRTIASATPARASR